MGREIVYCTVCQTQLRGIDFDKEHAYRLEGQAYCEKCARELIATLPEDRVNGILSTFQSTHDDAAPMPPAESRGNRTTRIIKVLAANPGPRFLTGTTRRAVQAAPPEQSGAPLILGIAVAVLVLVGAAVLMLGGSSEPPPPTPKPLAARPVSVPAAPPVARPVAPSPVEEPAGKMLAAAREFARQNPDDLAKQIELFEKVGWEQGASRYSDEVGALLKELRRKVADRVAAALVPVETEVRAAIGRQDFKAAAEAIAGARTRRAESEWSRALDKLGEELDQAVGRGFVALRDQAVEARRRGALDEVRKIQDRVAGWGRPGLSRDLDAALAAASPPPPAVPPPPPPPDAEAARREAAANELFVAAESLHRDPSTRGDAVVKYCLLLSEHAASEIVARKRALVTERLEAAKDHVFLASDLRPTGAFRPAFWKKAGSSWMAETDHSVARAQHYLELAFPALPNIEYGAWVFAGACCAEAFVFHVQGTELSYLDPKTREKTLAEPGGGFFAPLKPVTSLLKSAHAAHGTRREPVLWQWVSIALPKYATAGNKRLRIFGDHQGFSVAWVAVSATRKAHPTEAEMRELEKQRPVSAPDAGEARLRAGLVAHWRLDEGTGSATADATGHGHQGTLRNGGSWTSGKIGKALKFDGEDDHLDCGTNDALNVRKAVTLSSWVKCAADPIQWDGVAMKSNKDWNAGYGLWFETRSQIRFFAGYCHVDFALSEISAQEWNHVAGTYDGKRVRIFVNGKEGTGKDRAGEIPPCPEPFVIGRGSQTVSVFDHTLNGEIDDVRLYDRALDESEIRALYALRR